MRFVITIAIACLFGVAAVFIAMPAVANLLHRGSGLVLALDIAICAGGDTATAPIPMGLGGL